MPVQVTTPTSIRALPRLNATREQLKQMQGPPVTVFVGKREIKYLRHKSKCYNVNN